MTTNGAYCVKRYRIRIDICRYVGAYPGPIRTRAGSNPIILLWQIGVARNPHVFKQPVQQQGSDLLEKDAVVFDSCIRINIHFELTRIAMPGENRTGNDRRSVTVS